MLTRKNSEETKTNDLIGEVIRGARVFLSGGQELPVLMLETTIQQAAEQVLDRLFPKFRIADSSNWPTVWKKAKDGNAGALQNVGFNGDPDKHPVAKEIIQFVGAGKKGSEIIARFTKEGYGWPKDAIDATLLTLMVSGHLGARLQGKPVQLSDLDQRKISQVDFRVEHPVLTVQQKVRIRKLYQDAGIQFQPGDEANAAQQYLQALKNLSTSAGGEPPAPIAPQAPLLIDLAGKMGNDLLFELFEKADELTKKNTLWKDISKEIRLRIPHYEIARRLIAQAAGLADIEKLESALDAISNSRTLLDNPDPVAPVLKAVGTTLRSELHAVALGYKSVYDAELKKLEANTTWTKLTKQKKDAIFCECDICGISEPEVGADSQLEAELNACSLSHWRTLTDALPRRFEQALEKAFIESEPKAVRVDLPSATIRNKKEMEDWLTEARESIEESLEKGPVII